MNTDTDLSLQVRCDQSQDGTIPNSHDEVTQYAQATCQEKSNPNDNLNMLKLLGNVGNGMLDLLDLLDLLGLNGMDGDLSVGSSQIDGGIVVGIVGDIGMDVLLIGIDGGDV